MLDLALQQLDLTLQCLISPRWPIDMRQSLTNSGMNLVWKEEDKWRPRTKSMQKHTEPNNMEEGMTKFLSCRSHQSRPTSVGELLWRTTGFSQRLTAWKAKLPINWKLVRKNIPCSSKLLHPSHSPLSRLSRALNLNHSFLMDPLILTPVNYRSWMLSSPIINRYKSLPAKHVQ